MDRPSDSPDDLPDAQLPSRDDDGGDDDKSEAPPTPRKKGQKKKSPQKKKKRAKKTCGCWKTASSEDEMPLSNFAPPAPKLTKSARFFVTAMC